MQRVSFNYDTKARDSLVQFSIKFIAVFAFFRLEKMENALPFSTSIELKDIGEELFSVSRPPIWGRAMNIYIYYI